MVETTSVAAAARPVQRVKSSAVAQFPIFPIPGARFPFQAGALISPWFYLGRAEPRSRQAPTERKSKFCALLHSFQVRVLILSPNSG